MAKTCIYHSFYYNFPLISKDRLAKDVLETSTNGNSILIFKPM